MHWPEWGFREKHLWRLIAPNQCRYSPLEKIGAAEESSMRVTNRSALRASRWGGFAFSLLLIGFLRCFRVFERAPLSCENRLAFPSKKESFWRHSRLFFGNCWVKKTTLRKTNFPTRNKFEERYTTQHSNLRPPSLHKVLP
jgi:hypothetical protein